MAEEKKKKDFSRYVLLGSFLGSLAGATIAMLTIPSTSEERKKYVMELQKDLFRPVKVKFAEMVEHIGDTLKKAIDEAAKETNVNTVQIPSDEEEKREQDG